MTKEEKYKIALEVVRKKDSQGMPLKEISKELGISIATAHRYYHAITSGEIKSADDMPSSAKTAEDIERLAVQIKQLIEDGKTQKEISKIVGMPQSSISDLKKKHIDPTSSVVNIVTSEMNGMVEKNPEYAEKVEKLLKNDTEETVEETIEAVEVEVASEDDQSKTIRVIIDYPDDDDPEKFLKEFGKRVFERLKLRPVFPWTKIPLEDE